MILHLNIVYEEENFWIDIEMDQEIEIDTFLFDRVLIK